MDQMTHTIRTPPGARMRACVRMFPCPTERIEGGNKPAIEMASRHPQTRQESSP